MWLQSRINHNKACPDNTKTFWVLSSSLSLSLFILTLEITNPSHISTIQPPLSSPPLVPFSSSPSLPQPSSPPPLHLHLASPDFVSYFCSNRASSITVTHRAHTGLQKCEIPNSRYIIFLPLSLHDPSRLSLLHDYTTRRSM